MTQTFALTNRYVDRLIAKTGKVYRSVTCMAVAKDEQHARQLAAQYDSFDIDWLDAEKITCEPIREWGQRPPEGFASFHVVEEGS